MNHPSEEDQAMDQCFEPIGRAATLELDEGRTPACTERRGRAPATYGVLAPGVPVAEFNRAADAAAWLPPPNLSSNEPPDAVYTFGSRSERFTQGSIGLALMSALLVAAAAAPGLFIIAVIASIGLGAWAMARLGRPYEVWTWRSGDIRFVSVVGAIDLRTTHILRVVRVVGRSSRTLREVRIEHATGTITLDGREDVYRQVRQLRPGIPVITEEYDDTD
jgi:hypothetical protein